MCRWFAQPKQPVRLAPHRLRRNILRISMSMSPMTALRPLPARCRWAKSAGRGSSMRGVFLVSELRRNRRFGYRRGDDRERQAVGRYSTWARATNAALSVSPVRMRKTRRIVRDEDLAVAGPSRFFEAPNDGLHHLIDQPRSSRRLRCGSSGTKSTTYSAPAVQFRVTALASEALDLGYRHGLRPPISESAGADVVELEGLDNGSKSISF